MTHHPVTPYGGMLVQLLVEKSDARELIEASRDWPSWDLTERQLRDVELLLNGAFSLRIMPAIPRNGPLPAFCGSFTWSGGVPGPATEEYLPSIRGIPGPYRFFFDSFDCQEPLHVHVERGDATCKFWLQPLTLAANTGFRREN